MSAEGSPSSRLLIKHPLSHMQGICHHTSICAGSWPSDQCQSSSGNTTIGTSTTSPPSHSGRPMTTHSNLNPSAPAFDPPLISPVLCTGSNPVVFLQTAVANISKISRTAHVCRRSDLWWIVAVKDRTLWSRQQKTSHFQSLGDNNCQ